MIALLPGGHMRLAAAALALALAAPAHAVKVQGFDVPETITLDGKELRHNGSGIRKKFVVKVYVGSLYLAAPARDAEAIVAADVPKSVQLRFMRDVKKGQMMDAFRDGFRANSAAEAGKLGPRLEKLGAALPAEMKEGSLLQISYVPGKGSVVQAEGGEAVVIEGKDFADALFRNWLGPRPADDDLKRRMLGG
jgi:hypothetical protein